MSENQNKTEEMISMADLQAELERIKAENLALKAKKHRSLSFKISDKGALSVYG